MTVTNNKKSKINFEILEPITNSQKDISNWLLLYCAEKITKKSNAEDKERRRNQLNNYKKAIMPDFKYKTDFKELNSQWWIDELKWYKTQSKNFEHETLIESLSYRLQVVFFRNHSACPFYKEVKSGKKIDADSNFIIENQKIFRKFLNQSIKIISSKRKFKPISDVALYFEDMKEVDINEEVFSSTYKLLGQDWRIAKDAVIGAGTGWAASMFLGPVFGAYIGNLAGFSGAAATSYGLAFLGGGSLAAGGFGMAGGSFILGFGFGVTNGVRGGIKGASIDKLNQMQAEKLLPLLLAIGRLQFEFGDEKIPKLIRQAISKRLKEFEKRLKIIEKKHDKLLDDDFDEEEMETIEKSMNSVKKSIKLYERAKDMSLSYDWVSGYNIYKELKSWVA